MPLLEFIEIANEMRAEIWISLVTLEGAIVYSVYLRILTAVSEE